MLLNLPRIFEYTTLIAITYNASNFPLLVPIVCNNICERIYSKIVVGESHYFVGLEVASELNLPGPQVKQFYNEYLNLRQMHKLVAIYQELQGNVGYFIKLFRLGKKEGLTYS